MLAYDRNSFTLYLFLIIIIFTISYPFLFYPLLETKLKLIYEQSFPELDSDTILRAIKGTIYIYTWVIEFSSILLRVLIFSCLTILVTYLLDIEKSFSFKELFSFFLSAEVILIIGKLFTIIFNYIQTSYQLGQLKLFSSPLTLSYYLVNDEQNIFQSNQLIDLINIYTAIYILYISMIINKKLKYNLWENIGLIFFIILTWMIIIIFNPIGKLFSVSSS